MSVKRTKPQPEGQCIVKKTTRGGQVVHTLCGREVFHTWENFCNVSQVGPTVCAKCKAVRDAG